MSKKKGTTTIFKRICFPLVLVMMLQFSVFYDVTLHGHIVSALNDNSVQIFTDRVRNREKELEYAFSSSWTNMELYNKSLNEAFKKYQNDAAAFFDDTEQQQEYLLATSDTLITMLRNNAVNGVFLILADSADVSADSEEAKSYSGLCIRDYDLTSGYTEREDLLIERCPAALIAELDCSLDVYWDSCYTFDNIDNKGSFFYEPLKAAYENQGVSNSYLSYLSEPHQYSENDREVISYSIPLISSNGTVYGVVGVELMTDYLATLLPNDELQNANTGMYVLAQYEEGKEDCRIVAANQILLKEFFPESQQNEKSNAKQMEGYEQLYTCIGKDNVNMVCYMVPMNVYDRYSPFENHRFVLVGIMREDALFEMSKEIRSSLVLVVLITFSMGFIGIFIVSHLLSRPVRSLAKRVQNRGAESDTKLDHINIREIDQLIDAIEHQSEMISKSKVRTEFFSRMSHDMRTPMNAIIGFSSHEFLESADREELLMYLEKINGSGKYLLGLINEVLDMTKIETGNMILLNEPFYPAAFWSNILSMIDELAAQKSIYFKKELHISTDRQVSGDQQKLSQIFMNLLSNAVKFTPEHGNIKLSVTQTEDSLNQMTWKVIINDTGIGMNKEFQTKLYEPFVQEHPNKEGTGLGLSIAHQLITLMGGSIECISDVGLGTVFTVILTLPIAQEKINLAEESQSGHHKDKNDLLENQHKDEKEIDQIKIYNDDELYQILSGKRILLCEDHELNVEIASGILKLKDMVVEIAENGQIAVQMFCASSPGYYDVILMDIRMPVMNGIEAARTIRRLDRPDAKNIPIIAMTANAFREDINETAEAGMNYHLSKPIEPQKLFQVLASQIDGRE